MAKLSIIIVNYNTAEFTKNCLDSILKYKIKDKYEIIVVDNGSDDNSSEIIKKNYPQIKIIENKSNLGFAAANNQALKIAQGNLFLLLNSDTIFLKPAVDLMAEELEKNKKIGIVGCQILKPDFSISPSAGQFPTILNLILNRISLANKLLKTYFINKKSYYQKEQFPDWLMGACLMIKRELINNIGLLDESFFMYGEDVDFCYRARLNNYLIKFIPQAQLIHYDLGKTSRNKLNKFVNLRKGLLIFFQKHYSKNQLFLLKFLIKAELLARLLLPKNKDRQKAYKDLLEFNQKIK